MGDIQKMCNATSLSQHCASYKSTVLRPVCRWYLTVLAFSTSHRNLGQSLDPKFNFLSVDAASVVCRNGACYQWKSHLVWLLYKASLAGHFHSWRKSVLAKSPWEQIFLNESWRDVGSYKKRRKIHISAGRCCTTSAVCLCLALGVI